MDAKERLELYEKALVDWLKPPGGYTRCGFCWYFLEIHQLNLYDSFEILPELFNQKTVYGKANDGYHYNGKGSTELGRFERVVALKNAIKEVKLLIEKENESNNN